MTLTETEIEKIRHDALKILFPLKQADESTVAPKNFLFTAKRSEWSVKLPTYYLIFFLFRELLNFKNLGKFEKIAWSFPLDFNGRAFLVEYRKFGVGVFIQNEEDEEIAKIIISKINGAVKKVKPYYNYIAEKAVLESNLNVTNNNEDLFSRYKYLRQLYAKQATLYIKSKDIIKTKNRYDAEGNFQSSISSLPSYKFMKQSNWLAISCIEAFFSWTEHLFIHLAIIANGLSDGQEISNLIEAEWKTKFVKAVNTDNSKMKKMYDELLIVRQQLRNFVAHGAFGKNGNAFIFHSPTGAIPVLLNHDKIRNRFSLTGTLNFDDGSVLNLIDDFIKELSNGPLKPAMYYTQTMGLPTIVTYSKNGLYRNLMKDFEAMKHYTHELLNEMDNSANMDW